jgi:hypothetical protein
MFQTIPEAGPVDHGLEAEAELVAGRARNRAGDRAGQRDRLLGATDLQVACNGDLVAVAGDRGRLERDVRRALDVEEVRREQVPLQVLVVDGDARDSALPRIVPSPSSASNESTVPLKSETPLCRTA